MNPRFSYDMPANCYDGGAAKSPSGTFFVPGSGVGFPIGHEANRDEMFDQIDRVVRSGLSRAAIYYLVVREMNGGLNPQGRNMDLRKDLTRHAG